MTFVTDQAANTVEHVYDLAGRLTDRKYRYPNGTSPQDESSDPVDQTDSFTHDDDGLMLTAQSSLYDNTVALTYDAAGRKATETLTIGTGAGQRTYTIASGYNKINLRDEITYPDNSTVAREYKAPTGNNSDRDMLYRIRCVLSASVYESSAGICYRCFPGEISWRMIDEQDEGRGVGEAGEGSTSVRAVASHAASPITAARIAVGGGGRVGA